MAPHILIVDADVSAAEVTSAVVRRIAPEAILVCERTPDRAWVEAQHNPPDMIIIDPSPHGPAGAFFIQLCQAAWPKARVVVLASAPTPTLRAGVAGLKVAEYLEKPTASRLLVDKLRAVLETSRQAVRPNVELPQPTVG